MKYLISSAIILFSLACAKMVLYVINIQFPAPLLGMVFLLLFLLTGLVKEHQVKPSASPLLNIMPIFFIPAGVGFIEHLNLIAEHASFLMTVVILVPLTTIILLSQLVGSFIGRENNDDCE
ncbi:CidA/LrgA family protein [Pseudoalteromonas sp. MMG010]|uniref:CidA/LrgA family protein n=1 Tax=Pseudoalteromonas sp. MMG010 TaxID=2822685 RepID=UPI001B3A0B4B|nr:CidA/LrgA family protein [Pseudoalteromonas sp. MMG010]MBQ4831942.1 CidA/LrgA family protein [Pseudoalteromonas sp. MMG010]